MTTALEIAREYFPNASDETLDSIIWSRTGFPEFWNIPEDGNTPEECLRKQLQDFKNHVTPLCGKMLPSETEGEKSVKGGR